MGPLYLSGIWQNLKLTMDEQKNIKKVLIILVTRKDMSYDELELCAQNNHHFKVNS